MVGLFSFDGPMYKDINGVYCNTTITTEMLSRYLIVVDELIVIIRTISLNVTYQEANLKQVYHPNIKMIEMPNLNTIKGFILDKKKYISIIEKHVQNSDLIFCRMPSVISNIVISKALKMRKPYMTEVGGCAWDSHWNHSFKGKLVAPYVFIKQRIGIRKASYSSYVTEKWLQERYPSSGISISASNVYLEDHNDDDLSKRISKIESMNPEKKIIFGTAAAVNVKYKGQQYMIRALSKLVEKGYNVEYQLIGVGDTKFLKEIAEKYNVSNRVVFLGVCLHDHVLKWMSEIDFYVQPSKQEGLPRSVIEALSKGCPVIGSNVAGIPELLEEKYVFRTFKINSIVTTILNVLNDKKGLLCTAEINYKKSKEFSRKCLDSRRNKMYSMYKDKVVLLSKI